MPEYVVGLVNFICKNPNVKSRFTVLSRSSKAAGFMVYSPELGIFVCADNNTIMTFIYTGRYNSVKNLVCWVHTKRSTYRYDVDEYEFGCDRYFSVTVKRYLYLGVEIRSEILPFPGDFYFFRLPFPYRRVLEPNTFGSRGRSLCRTT